MATSPTTASDPETPTWTTAQGLEEVKALEKFHSTVRIYKDLFSGYGARAVNWSPLMDVKYQQILKHCQTLKALKASFNAKTRKNDEDRELYHKVSQLYRSALHGYTELCEILTPRSEGLGAGVIGGIDQSERGNVKDDNLNLDDIPRNIWRSGQEAKVTLGYLL